TATVVLVAYVMLSSVLAMLFPVYLAAGQKAGEKITTRQSLPRLLGGAGASFIAFGYFSGRPAFELWMATIGFLFIWWMALESVIKLSGQVLGSTWGLVLAFGPVAVFAVYMWGIENGYHDLSQRGQGYSLVRDESPQSADAVNLLRVFERGILVRYP